MMGGRRSPLTADNCKKSVCCLLLSIAAVRDGVTQCSTRRGGEHCVTPGLAAACDADQFFA